MVYRRQGRRAKSEERGFDGFSIPYPGRKKRGNDDDVVSRIRGKNKTGSGGWKRKNGGRIVGRTRHRKTTNKKVVLRRTKQELVKRSILAAGRFYRYNKQKAYTSTGKGKGKPPLKVAVTEPRSLARHPWKRGRKILGEEDGIFRRRRPKLEKEEKKRRLSWEALLRLYKKLEQRRKGKVLCGEGSIY